MAIRIVIADDEKFVLVVLKKVLQSIRYPVEIVGEAQDGVEAYCLCQEKKPDVLITDICMPLRDGLDLLGKIRQTMPDLPVVILSGYDNFSYAQQAIHYGIEEYLLKPVDEAKLEQAIGNILKRQKAEKVRERLETRNQILRQYLKHRPLDAIAAGQGAEWNPAEEAFLNDMGGCTLCVLCLRAGEDIRERQWYSWFLGRDVYCWTLDPQTGRLTALLQSLEPEVLSNAANEIWGKGSYVCHVQRLANEVRTAETPAERARRQLQIFARQIRQMDRALCNYFWGGGAHPSRPPEGARDAADLKQVSRRYFDRVAVAVESGRKEYLAQLLRQYWAELLTLSGNPEVIKETAREFMLAQMHTLELSDEDYKSVLRTLDGFFWLMTEEETLQKFLSCGTALVGCVKLDTDGRSGRNTREAMEHYLRENYRSDITLDQLAEYLHFNPSYTSNLCKKLFGKPFVAYLTAIRMDAAKELLESGTFKTYEVAAQVGYQDEKYFLKMFKKVVGCTPGEYRRQFKTRKLKNNGNGGAATDPESADGERPAEERLWTF